VKEHEGKVFIAKGRKRKGLRVELAILCNAKIEICNWSLLPSVRKDEEERRIVGKRNPFILPYIVRSYYIIYLRHS
jgi:hypothetical protein